MPILSAPFRDYLVRARKRFAETTTVDSDESPVLTAPYRPYLVSVRRRYDEENVFTFYVDDDSFSPDVFTISSDGPTPVWRIIESDGEVYEYNDADFTHTRVADGTFSVQLYPSGVYPYVTEIDLRGVEVTGNLAWFSATIFPALTLLRLYNTSIVGDFSVLSGHTNLTTLDLRSLVGSSMRGDISAFANMTSLTSLDLSKTDAYGDIEHFANLTSLTSLNASNTDIDGNISNLANMTAMVTLRLYTTGVSGSLTSLAAMTSLATLDVYSTNISGGNINANVALGTCQIQDLGWAEATVDALLEGMYNNWAGYTDATPVLKIGGTNATPSGTLQDGDPPTTGLEYIYEMHHDPESTGNETWEFWWNGGHLP